MKTIKTNVYAFSELSKEAKAKAREWYKEFDDMPFLMGFMQTELNLLLNKNKITAE